MDQNLGRYRKRVRSEKWCSPLVTTDKNVLCNYTKQLCIGLGNCCICMFSVGYLLLSKLEIHFTTHNEKKYQKFILNIYAYLVIS